MSSLPLYYPNGFSLSQSHLCAQLVDLAYQQYAQWHTQGRPREPDRFVWRPAQVAGWAFSAPIWSVLSELHLFNESEPFGFAARDPDGAVYLVFRGTDTVHDWLTDFDVAQREYPWQQGVGNVHAGFLKLYNSLRIQAMQRLDEMVPRGELRVCGHSLGSALSSLAVLDMRERWPNLPLQHYNFASPRLASPAFARYYNAMGVPTWRVVNDSDLVPDLPPCVSPRGLYQHLGLAVTFTASYTSVTAAHSLTDCYLYALNNPQAPMMSG